MSQPLPRRMTSDLERVQPDPLARAIVHLAAILSDHIKEHDDGPLDWECRDRDLQTLHDVRRQFDPRIVTDTYVDGDPDS